MEIQDFRGSGLNRGSTFKRKKPLPEGVIWSEHIKKWLVRIKKANGFVSTICAFTDKVEAESKYKKLIKEHIL